MYTQDLLKEIQELKTVIVQELKEIKNKLTPTADTRITQQEQQPTGETRKRQRDQTANPPTTVNSSKRDSLSPNTIVKVFVRGEVCPGLLISKNIGWSKVLLENGEKVNVKTGSVARFVGDATKFRFVTPEGVSAPSTEGVTSTEPVSSSETPAHTPSSVSSATRAHTPSSVNTPTTAQAEYEI